MACSAYPYSLYLAGRLSADMGGKVLVIDGDVQSPLVDENDHATGKIFSDACTATVVSANHGGTSNASILGRITIGHHSVIGGNIWLTHSVPPYSRIQHSNAIDAGFQDGAGI